MYQFDRESYQRRMTWYTHDRFGMFIHWGLYSIPARGEWVRSTEQMPESEYVKFFEEFDAADYDPKSWARAAKEAGMKYVVLTAKHHDGFCLFDSQYTDWKATNTKAGRDLIREYVDAVRAEGLRVGLYYSLLDWHHPDYPHFGDRIHPDRNRPECGNENRVWERYLEYFHNQVRELCTNYGRIDLLWFDFSYDDMRGEKWGATKLMNMVRELQPDVIIDNRLEVSGEGRGSLAECRPTPYHGDFVSPEQMIPPEGILDVEGNPMVWEACVTMNGHWGFCGTDRLFKPAPMLIKKLVECVSKGGNLLLNVGPDARGNIPEESMAILGEIGRWMKKNHESIYGCGRADVEKPEFGRITQNGDTYYFHIYENTIGPIPLPGLRPEEIVSIRALENGYEIPVSTSWVHSDYPELCFADLGEDPVLPDPVDYVLAVRTKRGNC
ncbi:alpha-L-fucosidase [Lachnoclostridium sp. Marseille-P6806]|uniref:alpha-L-fucosidase n=1 Tax=Lachnoclostridium sp. Marseille-P6806 TaxID=2364793 RepID=UPI001031FBAA|nr:alpha-L-fucosidase [Lachnoclostridium sp. Marseille-P6806]